MVAFQRLNVTACISRESAMPSHVRQQVVCADALEWLRNSEACSSNGEGGCLPGQVVTGLPDISEIHKTETVPQYIEWFKNTVTLILHWMAPRAVLVLC
eukprot:COSAG01_NODE_8076_length_2930_cov_6.566231_1_plen_99_part_00